MANHNSGLFLDLDGTIADSLDVMMQVYCKFLALFGKSGTQFEFNKLNGPPLTEVVANLAEVHKLHSDSDALLDIYKQLIIEAYDTVEVNLGAEVLMSTAKNCGMSVAIITSNSSILTHRWLQRKNLACWVDAVVGSEQVKQGKPNPEPFTTGLEVTNSIAQHSIAIDDSSSGVRSALAANLKTFQYSKSKNQSIIDGAIQIVSLDEVTQHILKTRMEPSQ